MARTIYLCDDDGNLLQTISVPDAGMLLTTMGSRAASSLAGGDKSTLTIDGADANGNVAYTAKYGGLWGDEIQVGHVVGDTGAGHEDRALAYAWDGKNMTVTFGTDSNGDSVVPTATQVAALFAADTKLDVVAEGTGASTVGAAALASLENGSDSDDYIVVHGWPGRRRVATVEVV